uniref:T9SS type A sorting domain-containing protein n=1 Tax=Psychroflexus aestuariivivens TaxID=1795040 RepID=UPI001300B8C8
MKTTLLPFCLCLMCLHFGYSQTTNIPDEGFEQALIDLGIDSDGTVNGQVLTADIETITELDLSTQVYSSNDLDITGISGFTALEILNLYGQPIYWVSGENEDILNSNLNLREIYLNNQSVDVGPFIYIESLDLSNLEHLEYVDLGNVYINSITLDNSSYNYENLTLNLFIDYDLEHNFCIQVSDPEAASNNEAPYNTWSIYHEDFYTNYSFTSNCNLNTEDFQNLNSISVYPNPVQSELNFENPKQINLDEVQIFNMKGQLVKSFTNIKNSINLDNLNQGVYFVKVKSELATETFK